MAKLLSIKRELSGAQRRHILAEEDTDKFASKMAVSQNGTFLVLYLKGLFCGYNSCVNITN